MSSRVPHLTLPFTFIETNRSLATHGTIIKQSIEISLLAFDDALVDILSTTKLDHGRTYRYKCYEATRTDRRISTYISRHIRLPRLMRSRLDLRNREHSI